MEDYIILDYLRNKGMDNSQGILQRFKNYMAREMRHQDYDYGMSSYEDPYMMKNHYNDDQSNKYSRMRKHSMPEDIDEYTAKQLVMEMFHYENGKKVTGEKFDMRKAKEVCDRFRGMIPSKVTVEEIYLAINAQYHDYCMLFKTWFGSNAEPKIIESAIVFWFKDEDSNKDSKIIDYLMNK